MKTWWIDPPNVAGSPNPTPDELQSLKNHGFGAIICLLDPAEQIPEYDVKKLTAEGFSWHCIPVRDFSAPTLEQIEELVQVVEGFKADGKKVLIHCWGGTGRTGTMAAAYWIARGDTADQAIAKIRQVRPGAVETTEQRARLQEFEVRRAG